MVASIVQGSASSFFVYDSEHASHQADRLCQRAAADDEVLPQRRGDVGEGRQRPGRDLGTTTSRWSRQDQFADHVTAATQVTTSFFVLDHLGSVAVIT